MLSLGIANEITMKVVLKYLFGYDSDFLCYHTG